jgi:endonuclease/exonuclease/phosphatase family metal-dependent hydrolase
VRVVTLNLWARSGPYPGREQLLRREVALLAPHLLALQEVAPGPDDGNQGQELFAPLAYEVVFHRRESDESGIAVASRFPVLDRRVIELPHNGLALAVRVNAEGRHLWFCCANPLPWQLGEERGREACAVVLNAAMTELAAGDDTPPILAGDFDATPDSASIRFLTGLQSLQGVSTMWVDAWAAAGDGSPGYTWTSENPYVAPFTAAVFGQRQHHRRIDYILVGSPFRWPPSLVVRSCQVVFTGYGETAPSDHYGVLADLEFDGVALSGGRDLKAWHDLLWPPSEES